MSDRLLRSTEPGGLRISVVNTCGTLHCYFWGRRYTTSSSG